MHELLIKFGEISERCELRCIRFKSGVDCLTWYLNLYRYLPKVLKMQTLQNGVQQ
jgi:hypothetical protein